MEDTAKKGMIVLLNQPFGQAAADGWVFDFADTSRAVAFAEAARLKSPAYQTGILKQAAGGLMFWSVGMKGFD